MVTTLSLFVVKIYLSPNDWVGVGAGGYTPSAISEEPIS